MEKIFNTDSIPLGLGMALSQNASAMQRFAEMSYDERQYVIDAAHTISSKKEMKAYVSAIENGGLGIGGDGHTNDGNGGDEHGDDGATVGRGKRGKAKKGR